jgi:ribose 5-phosphate isomerase B
VKIGLASDHAGFKLKNGILSYLDANNIPFQDYGCGPGEKVDYVDFAVKALKGREDGECDRLILVCGTGLGMSIVANKHNGIRATLCCDDYMAEMSRKQSSPWMKRFILSASGLKRNLRQAATRKD